MHDHRVIIERINLVNFKKFTNASVVFDPRLTVLSGKNGAGKSTVLSGVKHILSWIIARLRNDSGVGQYVPSLSVNNSAINGCVMGSVFDGEVVVPNKAKPGIFKEYSLNITSIKEYSQAKRRQLVESKDASLPVFAYYGVRRAVLDMPIRTRRKEYALFDAYDKCLDGVRNGWRSMQILQYSGIKRSIARRNACSPGCSTRRPVRTVCSFSQSSHALNQVKNPRKLAVTLIKSGQTINAEQLSDGEKIYLALIGDLCHRLSVANPSGDPLLGEGIVLIDEVDLHLHPQWQSEVANKLSQTFPNIQFIISTHSPHVINSVPTASLRLIDDDGAIDEAPYGYGMPSEVVLSDLMSLSHDVPSNVIKIIDSFNDAIVRGDASNAKEELLALQALVPHHPELPRMRKRAERVSR